MNYLSLSNIWPIHSFFHKNDVVFEFYKKYINDNGPEPNLPGFFLSNEQMFWVAMQNKKCLKGKSTITDGTALEGIRSKVGFWQTFNCDKKSDWIDWPQMNQEADFTLETFIFFEIKLNEKFFNQSKEWSWNKSRNFQLK